MQTIQLEKRDPAAKAKQLRRFGIVPCVVSGKGWKESLVVQLDQTTARQIQRTQREGSKVELSYEGKQFPAMLQLIERNNSEVIHLTFQAISQGAQVKAKAHVVLKNKDKISCVLQQQLFDIPYSAQAEDLLETVCIDLTKLKTGDTVSVGDLPEFQDEKRTLQIDAGTMVLRLQDTKRASAPGTE